jgi:ATP phosphoribosyltransferase regulatory subunit
MSASGLWFESTEQLRSLEEGFLAVCGGRGYREVRPPLLIPALRSDFTGAVGWMVARRGAATAYPLRLCYRGAVVRRSGDEEIELHQAGCERLSDRPGPEGDEEVAVLAGESLAALGLDGAMLELGHWGLVGPLMERVPWPEERVRALEQAVNRKSVPGLDALEERHGRLPEIRLMRRLVHLGGRPGEVEALRLELRAAGVEAAWEALRELGASVRRALPSLAVRLDPTDVRRWSYYTGMTIKAFSPRHAEVVLSGGRYDGSYPPAGPVRGACGFAVHLSRLVEES